MAEVTEAQAPIATVTTDPQALSVLQRSLAALTPNIVVQDVTLSGSAHYIAGSDDETGTAVLKATALGDSRLDLTLPSGMITEIDNLSATSPAGAWFADDRTLHKVALHNLLAKPLGSPRIPVLQISATIGGLAPNSSVPFPLQSARPSNTALPHLLTVPSIKVDLVQQTSSHPGEQGNSFQVCLLSDLDCFFCVFSCVLFSIETHFAPRGRSSRFVGAFIRGYPPSCAEPAARCQEPA